MTLDTEMAHALVREVGRVLIEEEHPTVDEARYEQVMALILGEGGTQNAFDAPILYALLELNAMLDGLSKPKEEHT